MHLDNGLADEGCAEEGPEGHQEVAARYASQVEQGVGDLEKNLDDAAQTLHLSVNPYRGAGEDAEKADPLDDLLNPELGTVEHILK